MQRLDSHTREILSKGAVAFAVKVTGVALAFAYQIVLARFLGADRAGIYFLVFTFAGFVATISRIGMDNAVTRYVASYAAEEAWDKSSGVVLQSIRITSAAALLGTIVSVLASEWLARSLFGKPELTMPLRIMALSVFPLAIVNIYASALQGIKQVRDSMLVLVVSIPLFAGIFLVFLVPAYGLIGAVASFVLGSMITMLIAWQRWRSATRSWHETPSFSTDVLMASSVPLFGVTLCQQLMQALPTILLGIWGANADVGRFNAALRTSGLVSLVLISGNAIIAPKFAALYHTGDRVGLKHVARRGAFVMTAMALPPLAVFIAFPTKIMLLFGPDFGSGAVLLVILAAGQLVNVATGPVGFLLSMTGRERELLNAAVIAILLNGLLCAVLLPLYGATGAAAAAAISLASVNLLRLRYVRTTLGITVLPLPDARRDSIARSR